MRMVPGIIWLSEIDAIKVLIHTEQVISNLDQRQVRGSRWHRTNVVRHGRP